MTKDNEKYQAYVQILNEELIPAMGCTEPIALAYAAAKAREVLGCLPDRVCIGASGSIIKNVKSVIVPNTDHLKGIPAAATAGIVAGKAEKELEAIAEAKGIDISKADRMSGRGSAVPPKARYSTLQDLDAGRHTEIDMFSGALMRMGKELGIPTPYNEYTYHMIKALEEKNDGRFAYTGEEEPTWSK